MTRIPYDQTAKQLLDGALERVGHAKVQHEVSNDPQWIDVWFERDAAKPMLPGLFGRMVAQSCAFEVFHGAPRVAQALDCLAKQLGVYRRRRPRSSRAALVAAPASASSRTARFATPSSTVADHAAPASTDVPPMWLVTTHRPTAAMKELHAEPLEGWPTGFYRMKAPALPLYLVALGELPRVRDTLILRLMGAKDVLRSALEELGALPQAAWERAAATDAVRVLQSLAARASRIDNPNEQVIVMSAMETYLNLLAEGRRALLLRQLRRRFGRLPRAIVTQIKEANSRKLDRWGDRFVTATTLDEVFNVKSSRTLRA